MAGYKNDNPATGLLDAQRVRAAYISDGSTSTVVAAVDCVGLSGEDIKIIRERASSVLKKYGVDSLHVAATHTHAGIDTLGLWGPVGIDGKNDAFMEKLFDAAVTAVEAACSSAKEGKLYFGIAPTGAIQRDSRLPEIYDDNIYRLRFEPLDGSGGVQIISYDAHAESLRGDNTLVSGDYPVYMGKRIKEVTGDDYVFFAGAVGGLIMTRRLTDETGAEYPVEQNVVLTGEYLADALLESCTERELEPALSLKSSTVKINLDNPLYVAMTFAGALNYKAVDGGGEYNLALNTGVSLLKLGGDEGVSIAMIPGEIFPELVYGGSAGELAASLQNENPPSLRSLLGDNLIVWGLCDDEIGYIVTPDDFLTDETAPCINEAIDKNGRKHYEETNSVGIEAAWKIYEAFAALAQ